MNTRRKEYEEIYDYSNYGFLFYYNKRISKSIPISKEDMRKISIGKGNGFALAVELECENVQHTHNLIERTKSL